LQFLAQVSQISAVFWLLATSRQWAKSRHILQDDERLCVGVSDDAWTSDAPETEEGDTATAQHDPWENDCWGRCHRSELFRFWCIVITIV